MGDINVYKLEDISEPIEKRLLDWARKNSLPPKMMRYTQKRIREFEVEEVSDELTKGWQCGLGQMLDLGNEVLYSVLPYALTAYMYHCGRPSNRFISDFLNCVLRDHKDDDFASDAYLGITGKSLTDKKDGAATTILGKLLLKNYKVDSGGAKTPLKNLAKCFTVSGVTLQVLPSTEEVSEANFQIVPDSYGGQAFERRKEQIYNKSIEPSVADELPEEYDDADIDKADRISGFTYVQEPMNIRDEIKRLSSALEPLAQTGKPSREQLKAFAKAENDLGILNAEVDEINKQLKELGETCERLRQGAYSKAKLDNEDPVRGYYPNYETFIEIFVIWYHIWSEAEKGKGASRWKPAYEIDPIQCILLFARSFWDSKLYKAFKESVDNVAEKGVVELRCNMDRYLREQYTMLREEGICDFMCGYQPVEVLSYNRQ